MGIGAFGRVQLAKLKKPIEGLQATDDGYFALKCLSKQSLKESGLEGQMHNEKNIMTSLDHPFINKFYCEMEDEKHLYFLLEPLTGGELCKRLREEKKFPEPWGRFYSASVLFAFCHMHAMKIAYRDLKPEVRCRPKFVFSILQEPISLTILRTSLALAEPCHGFDWICKGCRFRSCKGK
jgi:serine/threonine protein kinase